MADLLDDPGVDFTVTLSGGRRPLKRPDGTEPCENCATPVVGVDPITLLHQLAGNTPPEPARETPSEVHTGEDDDGHWLAVRAHTTERCRRARAGDPEPLDRDDDPED